MSKAHICSAVIGSHEALVAWLLEAGADPNKYFSVDGVPLTPLGAAAVEGNVCVLRSLVDAGARVNDVCGKMRATPLHICVKESHVEAARLLLSRGADPNAVSTDGDTQLLYALKAPALTRSSFCCHSQTCVVLMQTGLLYCTSLQDKKVTRSWMRWCSILLMLASAWTWPQGHLEMTKREKLKWGP